MNEHALKFYCPHCQLSSVRLIDEENPTLREMFDKIARECWLIARDERLGLHPDNTWRVGYNAACEKIASEIMKKIRGKVHPMMEKERPDLAILDSKLLEMYKAAPFVEEIRASERERIAKFLLENPLFSGLADWVRKDFADQIRALK